MNGTYVLFWPCTRGTTTDDARTARSTSNHLTPTTRSPISQTERIKRRPVLGGLINEYEPAA